MKLSDRINDTDAAHWVIEEIRKLEVERESLAAHVKRISTAWDSCGGLPGFADCKVLQAIILASSPDTSLAHLKAKWQVEVLEEYREELGSSGVVFVDCLAKYLRRKAEEDEHD